MDEANRTTSRGAGDAGARLASALAVLGPVLDVVDGAVDDPAQPEWCQRRGWGDFLLALDDVSLAACERGDAAPLRGPSPGLPRDLARLARDVDRLTRVPRFAAPPLPLPATALRGVAARKREQVAALLGVIAPLAARAERIVDVGAGHGHLSRLAAELLDRHALAIERDAAAARAGAERAARRARDVGELPLSYLVADACAGPPVLGPADLAIGLHACGELGDRIVLAAAAAGCDLALISCCLQKTRSLERAPLSRAGAPLRLRRATLGLTNLTPQPIGVEGSLEAQLAAREARLGLRALLRARGLEVAPGEEMRGLNRRRAHAGLADLASRALALRGLAPASPRELRPRERAARRDHGAIRRLSLPRHLLARLVELAVVLDRAAYLEEHGGAVRVATFCERAVTPRNLALVASADPGRLPPLA
jgi:SAM-dependent methyltransferase